MLSFLKTIAVFLIPITIVSVSLEIYLRNRTSQNEVLSKLELIKQNKDARLIFLGNSHGRNAFIPEIFDPESINLCIGGSTSFYNHKLLESSLEKLPDLQYIIYNLSYQTLFYDMDALPNKRKAYEFYHYMGAESGLNRYSTDYYSILSTIGFRKAIDSFVQDCTGQEPSMLKTRGYKEEISEIAKNSIKSSSIQRIGDHHKLMNYDKLSYNVEQLNAIEDLAAQNDIQIIYTILPVIDTYNSEIKKPYDSYAGLAHEIAKKKKNLFYNLGDSLNLDSTHFVDPDHVNKKGAEAISQYLSQKINFTDL